MGPNLVSVLCLEFGNICNKKKTQNLLLYSLSFNPHNNSLRRYHYPHLTDLTLICNWPGACSSTSSKTGFRARDSEHRTVTNSTITHFFQPSSTPSSCQLTGSTPAEKFCLPTSLPLPFLLDWILVTQQVSA